MRRRWVSLGGWCGPGLMLSKLGMRPVHEQLPFDAVRASLDGIVHFVTHGFRSGGFFPNPGPPFRADAASVWLLFRGEHTCFTHVDLNSPAVLQDFEHKFDRWAAMVKDADTPVTFLRTSIASHPVAEAALLPLLEDAIDKCSNGKLDFRILLALHDPKGLPAARDNSGNTKSTNKGDTMAAGATLVGAPTQRSRVWKLALDPSLPSSSSLLDKCEVGYRQIIQTSSSDEWWLRTAAVVPWSQQEAQSAGDVVNYTALCTVEGVPALRGSCVGIGTTTSAAIRRCAFCGSTDGHAVQPGAFDTHRPWTDAEDADLLSAWMQIQDSVATCERVGIAQSRSAHEVLTRLAHITQGFPRRPWLLEDVTTRSGFAGRGL